MRYLPSHLAVIAAIAFATTGCATAAAYGTVGDDPDLYTGVATGYMTRTGSIELTNARGNRCTGDFAYYPGVRAGRGVIACDDGQRAAIEFTGLSSVSGYGAGITGSGHRVAFTYGMNRAQSMSYLSLLRGSAGGGRRL